MTRALDSCNMHRMASAAETFASSIADLRPDSIVAIVPVDVQSSEENWGSRLSWEPFTKVRPETVAALEQFARELGSLALGRPPGVHLALEGVRRAMLEGRKGRDKFAAAIVHVIADGEPARVVVLNLEKA